MSLPKKARLALSAFGWSVLGVLLIIIGYLIFMSVTHRVPTFFGNSYMRIVTSSMEPVIPAGMFIQIKQVDPAQVQVDDIIAFYSTDPSILDKPNTHRVVAVERTERGYIYTTKGDNNAIVDKYTVSSERLIGRYVQNLPLLAAVGSFLSNQLVFLLLILVPALLLVTAEINNLSKKARALKEQQLIEEHIEQLRREDEQAAKGEQPDDNA